MPNPAPSVMSAALSSGGNSFSSGLFNAFGYGAGAAGANLAGQMLTGNGVNFRGKYARNQAQFARDQLAPDMIARMKAAKAAGIHPLIALGLNPASAPQQPMIPGQSADFGSAIKAGVDTTLAIRDAREMSSLRIEEQQLRNDWLRMQILNSARARGAQAANGTRPPVRPLAPSANPANAAPRTAVTSNGTVIDYPGGTTADSLETEINDWAQWMPETMVRAFHIARGQIRDYVGIDNNATWYDRLQSKRYRKQYTKARTKARHAQAYYGRRNRYKGKTITPWRFTQPYEM